MESPAARRLARRLADLGRPGDFATCHLATAQGLALTVDGVGEVRLPVDAARAQQLIDAARPSPFGHRDQTLHDPEVRDSWELPAEAVTVEGAGWARRLERAVQAVAEGLGLPPEASVRPRLHKLLVYGPGQFFAPHRDTERTPGTAATLVVVLPGDYAGGELVVRHQGEERVYDTAPHGEGNQLAFVGLYADCLHETRPVTAGHRVVLTFSLEVDRAVAPPVPEGDRASLRELLQPLGAEADGPWVVHLLAHQYSQQSARWDRLKNGDRSRAAALREVATDAGMVPYLALIEAQRTYRYDEVRGTGEQLDQELRLMACFDNEGRLCKLSDDRMGALLAGAHVVTLPGTSDWRVHDEEEWPWTGNEGGHAMKWYHLTAVLLVPRSAPDLPRSRPARGRVVRRRRRR